MLIGLSGSLLSHHYAGRFLHADFGGHLGEHSATEAYRRFRRWWAEAGCQLGPASSVRLIWNAAAAAVAEQLGFTVGARVEASEQTQAALLTAPNVRVVLLAGSWTMPLDSLWRNAVRSGIDLDAPWSLCTNGRQLRLVDAHRTYSRAHLEFDLQRAAENAATFQIFWGVLRAEAFDADQESGSLLDRIIAAAARQGHAVNRSLRFGVIDAVQHLLAGLSTAGPPDVPQLFDESLTVVYRTLFLMFAEARGLVPNWHPIYREHYTIESLRDRIERPGHARGLWETLQAIARLAHHGCRAGSLVVPPFNGRLFSPARSPVVESCTVEDELARKALLRLSTTTTRKRQTRIDYQDLGVEQLGAVYESILDYTPSLAEPGDARIVLRRGGDRRKSTGSFYTPQSLTDYLVRRTLHPLVAEASAERILQLRIVDPAMGSAAFLVSACRYLAGAYERALVREGARDDNDIDDTDRAGFRRQVARRCLFGVDLNPTAVQLARLSLWLATLAANKPLTFLDHRLMCGDSLLGASPADLARQPPRANRQRSERYMPLFSETELEPSLMRAVEARRWVADIGDDSAAIVQEKERRLDRLRDSLRWKSLADLWCSCWMWSAREPAPTAAVFGALSDAVTHGRSVLPPKHTTSLLEHSRQVARERRFFHWVLEFPEVFFDEHGHPLPDGGFDAVIGNPPWDVLSAASAEKVFFRHAGIYRHLGGGHINRYQAFVERALMLTRQGGRIGLLLPSGFATDHTAAPLRRRLLTRSRVDAVTGFDNRKAIFPIHRSMRFLICTATVGGATSEIACRFGIDDPMELERIPDAGDVPNDASHPIMVTPSLLTALSGDTLSIPELRSASDVRILERIVHQVPRLGDPGGWHVRFGRELNATDDRPHFSTGRAGLPILEGKHIEPFRAHVERATARIPERTAARLLDGPRTFLRPRLAYRDVASTTNRLSLICALLPAGVVTTHSLFCLKTALAGDNQAFLCGMLNSFVANYLVRQVMTTHLGSATVENLRVPKLPDDSSLFIEIAELARTLEREGTRRDHARLQALAARAYELTTREFEHVLSTFPLVDERHRAAAMEEFRQLTASKIGGSV